ncbi:MAG: FGGY-family carbohydrate kinase [Spirochaetota bacterium]
MGKKPVFLGIDLGTTGMRAIVADQKGEVVRSETEEVHKSFVESKDEKISEQDPREWEPALFAVLRSILGCCRSCHLMGICVDSTSGTILAVGPDHRPLHHALLHNDIRAQQESSYIKEHTGINVKPSFALSKILWIKNNMPELFEKTHKFIHAADYLRGLISGDFDTTDFSNAVKTGYDLKQYRWPSSISSKLGIPQDKLPRVVKTGDVTGELKKELAQDFGVDYPVKIVAGATDSTTSFYSSGAKQVGDWNTTLGTVLGIRGIASQFISDPEGLLYAHRHPQGFWLPGAASNTGGEGLKAYFGDRLKEYDRKVEDFSPTGGLVYPLVRKSEKFPFLNMDASGFINMSLTTPVQMFKAFLEGISFVERMIYQKIQKIGYQVNERVFSMGGGAYSMPWMHIRANILKKNICRARVVETAFGSAIIAAAGVYYQNLNQAIEHMTELDCTIEPEPEISKKYDDIYHQFLQECRRRGLF